MSVVDSSTLQGSRGTTTPETNKSDESIPQYITSKTSDVEEADAPIGVPPGMRPQDFPDGGMDAWLCVLGAWCGMFCTFGLNNCAGTFLGYYVQGPLASYGMSTVSWIVSTQAFVLSGTTAFWGFLHDCYGPQCKQHPVFFSTPFCTGNSRCAPVFHCFCRSGLACSETRSRHISWGKILNWMMIGVLVGGTGIYVFGMAMTSLGTQYWQFFLAQSIVAAAGSGAVFNACVVVIPSWFRRKRATAFGIMASGSSLGGVVLPIALNQLTARVGFPWALRAVALLFLTLCGIACLTVKSRLRPQPRPFVWAAYMKPLHEPPFALLAAGNFFYVLGMCLPYNYVVLEAEAAGIAPGLAVYLLPILNASSTAGRIAPGFLADRVGPFNTMTLMALLSGVLMLALWIPGGSAGAVIAFCALFGLISGGFVSLIPACVAQISDVREIGTRAGIAMCFQALGALVGSPIGGAILAANGGRYLGLQLFSSLVVLLSAAFYFLARAAQVGPRPLVKC